jgi:hypothetical protein
VDPFPGGGPDAAKATGAKTTGTEASGSPAPVGPQPPEPPPPPPPPVDEQARAEIKALRESAEATKAELEAVQAELGAEREQRAEEVVGLREKLEKAHADALAGLRFSGYMQNDWNAWNQASSDELNPSSGALLNDERFLIRRARLRAAIDRDFAAGVFELDGNTVNGATARIIDAEASLKLPGETPELPLVMVTIGLFKIPFGYEVVQSDRDRLFMERSTTSRALFPGEFDVGARLTGAWRFVRGAVAAQNGEPLGETATWPGRDPNHWKDITLHLGVDTPVTDRLSVNAGVSYLWGKGFHPGTPATKTAVQWNDRNQNGVIDPGEIVAVSGTPAVASRNFERFGYGANLLLALVTPGVGASTLYGEIYLAQDLDRGILIADPYGPLSRDLREIGGYVAFTQDLGPYFCAGFRYDYYNPDRDSTDPARPLVPTSFAYQTESYVVGAKLGLTRLTVEYDHNHNELGRDTAGNPTSMKRDAITVRGQVTF